jgi:hypothetical protein
MGCGQLMFDGTRKQEGISIHPYLGLTSLRSLQWHRQIGEPTELWATFRQLLPYNYGWIKLGKASIAAYNMLGVRGSEQSR